MTTRERDRRSTARRIKDTNLLLIGYVRALEAVLGGEDDYPEPERDESEASYASRMTAWLKELGYDEAAEELEGYAWLLAGLRREEEAKQAQRLASMIAREEADEKAGRVA